MLSIEDSIYKLFGIFKDPKTTNIHGIYSINEVIEQNFNREDIINHEYIPVNWLKEFLNKEEKENTRKTPKFSKERIENIRKAFAQYQKSKCY